MVKKTQIALIFLFLLTICTSDRRGKHYYGSNSKKGSGNSASSKTISKNLDDDYKRSKYSDDDDDLSRSTAIFRGNNYYAAKKLEQFGNKMSKSFAKLVKKNTYDPLEPKIVSGKKVKSSINRNFPGESTGVWLSNAFVYGLAAFGLIVILFSFMRAPTEAQLQQQSRLQAKRAKQKHREKYKHYDVMVFIQKHGVHPDRAYGKIYKVQI